MREELLSYGLSDKEIDLYLAALKTGDATASRLSEITGLTRTTVYDIAETLKKKGLLASYKQEKKYYFSANKPEALLTNLREKERLVKKILPSLKELRNLQPERPIITVYKGKIGLRTAADEMLGAKEILVYGGGIKADEAFGSYTANFAQKRAEKKGLVFTWQIDPKVPEKLFGDSGKLLQVLVNLTDNAIKFTDSGMVHIHITHITEETGTDQSITLCFAVFDTGMGVDANKQAAIFDPFIQADGSHTRQFGGTGLGLAICSRLVQIMSGRMWLQSPLSKAQIPDHIAVPTDSVGAAFYFTAEFFKNTGEQNKMPHSADHQPAVPTRKEIKPEGTLKILLAEDEIINREVATAVLADSDCQVTAVENGKEALIALEKDDYDVVVLDIQMPVMGGLQAAASIREQDGKNNTYTPLSPSQHMQLREIWIAASVQGWITTLLNLLSKRT